jgi:integrase
VDSLDGRAVGISRKVSDQPWRLLVSERPERMWAPKEAEKVWRTTLKKAEIPYFRIYDLRSTYATRLSAGGVADEWVTQLLRHGDSQVFKNYSQMKLTMKREALEKPTETWWRLRLANSW